MAMASSSTKAVFSSPVTPSPSSHPSQKPPSLLSFLRSTATSTPISNIKLSHSRSTSQVVVKSVLKTVTSPETSAPNYQTQDLKYPRPTILVSEKLGEAGLEVLRSFGNVECLYGLSPDELCSKISSCDALIVRSGTKVSRQVFEASKGRLKVVGRAGVGIDNVDLQAATEFGCLVVNAPTANTVAAAEHGIALLTSMARNIAQADASMKAGKFPIMSELRGNEALVN